MAHPKPKSYKYKLNMLEPGIVFCKIIVLLSVIAFVLFQFKFTLAATIASVIAGTITLIFIILLLIEQHQDRILYEAAKKENPEIK